MGGANRKYILVDDTGQQWLFKPQSKRQTLIEKAAAVTAHKSGVSSPIVYDVQIDHDRWHKRGSIQPLLVCAQFGLSKDLEELTQMQREELQRHHVVDRLLANADPHRDQFVILGDGRLVAIDKGQSMRLFPHDPLAWDLGLYPLNTRKSVYWYFRCSMNQGRFNVDASIAIDFASQVTSHLENSWLKLVWHPVFSLWSYAHLCLAATSTGERKQMVEAVLVALDHRLNNLASDFDVLYTH